MKNSITGKRPRIRKPIDLDIVLEQKKAQAGYNRLGYLRRTENKQLLKTKNHG